MLQFACGLLWLVCLSVVVVNFAFGCLVVVVCFAFFVV